MLHRDPMSRESTATESYTLTQLTEIVRGQADAVLKRTQQLERALGRGPIEKDTGHPERTHSGPGDILLNAKDDLHRLEILLTELIAYVGEPGEGPRSVDAPPRGEASTSRRDLYAEKFPG